MHSFFLLVFSQKLPFAVLHVCLCNGSDEMLADTRKTETGKHWKSLGTQSVTPKVQSVKSRD